ncbi:hypothetical protein ACQKJZ_08095 [Sphingomonas sp. NPDC019816]|uniref:hypothetical protein n=1 Tax=Sphingomonas sp. NPDC019816 TaxID=3390679 RepID=UPI003CFF373E
MKRYAIPAMILCALPATAWAQFVRPGPPADTPKPFAVGANTAPAAWSGGTTQIHSESRKIERSIRAGVKSGDITPAEARAFRRELVGIRSVQWRSGAPGDVPSGQVEVRSRLDALRGMVNARRVRGGEP